MREKPCTTLSRRSFPYNPDGVPDNATQGFVLLIVFVIIEVKIVAFVMNQYFSDGAVLAFVVGSYIAMLICFIPGFIIFFPTCYIKIRKAMGVDQ